MRHLSHQVDKRAIGGSDHGAGDFSYQGLAGVVADGAMGKAMIGGLGAGLEQLLPHLLPPGGKHITLTGDYIWLRNRVSPPDSFIG